MTYAVAIEPDTYILYRTEVPCSLFSEDDLGLHEVVAGVSVCALEGQSLLEVSNAVLVLPTGRKPAHSTTREIPNTRRPGTEYVEGWGLNMRGLGTEEV